MCVCPPRNTFAKLASKLDSNNRQHHWAAPLASTNNTTGQQHWPSPLVSTTGRQHWPGPLAPCSKHVGNVDANDVDDDDNGDDDDNDYDADYDYDDDDDANGDDGDRDDELKVHSNMCVHECARRTIHLPSWPARTGQHHWAAPLPSTINTTGQQHWPAPLASSTGVKYWVVCNTIMFISIVIIIDMFGTCCQGCCPMVQMLTSVQMCVCRCSNQCRCPNPCSD
jgi:hypothetical protein